MKTLAEINNTLSAFAETYGLDIARAQQGSAAWFQAKLGVISASNAARVVAKLDSETRLTYMAELVAQVATGVMEEINNKYMEWGHHHEDAARSHYEFETGFSMTQLPFVFKDESFRIGCSPDGIVTANKGAEIKCPFNSVHFIKFLTEDKIKGEYLWQAQFTLWVMGADEWDFVQYDPRMKTKPMHTVTVKRDADKIGAFEDMVPRFIADMDKMLERAGAKWGDQWTR